MNNPTTGMLLVDLKARLRREEGTVLRAYRDSLGHLTIADGFNLERPDADRLLSSMGLSPTAVRSGAWPITSQQAEQLLDYTAQCALTDAGDVVGREAWERLDDRAKVALADQVFQLGEGGVRGFHRELAALKAVPPRYELAAAEMLDSKWYEQTPARALSVAALMRSCADPPPEPPLAA